MHEYLISFTRVDYIKNLRAKFSHSNYARIAGVIFFGKLSEENKNYTKELCGGIP
jgi:hypothetical protein